jgi:hypothetical protein
VSLGVREPIRSPTWYGLICVYLFGLVLVGWYFRNALNTDAVAYLRIASYYANARSDLAISGYWGPLLSWLMALPLKAGLPALAVARGAMAFSAIVFLCGSVAVYRALKLSGRWLLTGAILSAACGLYWSVRFITPDLLLAGLVALAMSRMMSGDRSPSLRHDCLTGVIWGLAYLSKAIAFPLAILSTCSIAALHFHTAADRRLCLRKAVTILLAFALVAGPWVLTLSLKYGRPTFSTSARISHAVTGPPDVERYHPFARALHQPEPGRVTSWEEPSRMGYQYWSPAASSAYALHQVKVVLRNIPVCVALLTSLEVAWIIPGFYLVRQIPRTIAINSDWSKYGAVFVIPLLLVVLYLPTSVNLAEQRFFYPAFPFLFSAVASWANEKFHNAERGSFGPDEVRQWWLAVFGAAVPLLAMIIVQGSSPKYAGDCAVGLATRIERANIQGPVAGSGMLPGGRAGLYLAFLINQPWYGDEPSPTPRGFEDIGARLVVVGRGSQLARELAQDPDFADKDSQLFDNPQQSSRFPLQVYEVKHWRAAANR